MTNPGISEGHERTESARRRRLHTEIKTYEDRIVALANEITFCNEAISNRKRELAAMDRHPSATQTTESDDAESLNESYPPTAPPCS